MNALCQASTFSHPLLPFKKRPDVQVGELVIWILLQVQCKEDIVNVSVICTCML